jgi:hypothetical protein
MYYWGKEKNVFDNTENPKISEHPEFNTNFKFQYKGVIVVSSILILLLSMRYMFNESY